MDNIEQYLMHDSLKKWSQYESEIRDFFNICKEEFIYGQKRDNCGVIACAFELFMKSQGIEMKRVNGNFIADYGVFAQLDFFKEELIEMEKLKLNPKKLEDRMCFVKMFSLEERQKEIPHYWNVDVNGLIIDLSGYSQFVKTKLASNLNIDRYKVPNILINKSKLGI
jgi:hypothetical protein